VWIDLAKNVFIVSSEVVVSVCIHIYTYIYMCVCVCIEDTRCRLESTIYAIHRVNILLHRREVQLGTRFCVFHSTSL